MNCFKLPGQLVQIVTSSGQYLLFDENKNKRLDAGEVALKGNDEFVTALSGSIQSSTPLEISAFRISYQGKDYFALGRKNRNHFLFADPYPLIREDHSAPTHAYPKPSLGDTPIDLKASPLKIPIQNALGLEACQETGSLSLGAGLSLADLDLEDPLALQGQALKGGGAYPELAHPASCGTEAKGCECLAELGAEAFKRATTKHDQDQFAAAQHYFSLAETHYQGALAVCDQVAQGETRRRVASDLFKVEGELVTLPLLNLQSQFEEGLKRGDLSGLLPFAEEALRLENGDLLLEILQNKDLKPVLSRLPATQRHELLYRVADVALRGAIEDFSRRPYAKEGAQKLEDRAKKLVLVARESLEQIEIYTGGLQPLYYEDPQRVTPRLNLARSFDPSGSADNLQGWMKDIPDQDRLFKAHLYELAGLTYQEEARGTRHSASINQALSRANAFFDRARSSYEGEDERHVVRVLRTAQNVPDVTAAERAQKVYFDYLTKHPVSHEQELIDYALEHFSPALVEKAREALERAAEKTGKWDYTYALEVDSGKIWFERKDAHRLMESYSRQIAYLDRTQSPDYVGLNAKRLQAQAYFEIGKLSYNSNFRVEGADQARADKAWTLSAEAYAKIGEPLEAAHVYGFRAEIQSSRNATEARASYRAAAEVLQKAYEQTSASRKSKKADSELLEQLAFYRGRLALCQRFLGNKTEAEREFKEALSLYRKEDSPVDVRLRLYLSYIQTPEKGAVLAGTPLATGEVSPYGTAGRICLGPECRDLPLGKADDDYSSLRAAKDRMAAAQVAESFEDHAVAEKLYELALRDFRNAQLKSTPGEDLVAFAKKGEDEAQYRFSRARLKVAQANPNTDWVEKAGGLTALSLSYVTSALATQNYKEALPALESLEAAAAKGSLSAKDRVDLPKMFELAFLGAWERICFVFESRQSSPDAAQEAAQTATLLLQHTEKLYALAALKIPALLSLNQALRYYAQRGGDLSGTHREAVLKLLPKETLQHPFGVPVLQEFKGMLAEDEKHFDFAAPLYALAAAYYTQPEEKQRVLQRAVATYRKAFEGYSAGAIPDPAQFEKGISIAEGFLKFTKTYGASLEPKVSTDQVLNLAQFVVSASLYLSVTVPAKKGKHLSRALANLETATSVFQTLPESDPEYVPLHYQLNLLKAQVLSQMEGKRDEALASYEKALSLAESSNFFDKAEKLAELRGKIAELQIQGGNYEAAYEKLQRLAEAGDRRSERKFVDLSIQQAKEKMQEATFAHGEAVLPLRQAAEFVGTVKGDDHESLAGLSLAQGELAEHYGQKSDALVNYGQALEHTKRIPGMAREERDKRVGEVALQLCRLSSELGDWENVRRHYDLAVPYATEEKKQVLRRHYVMAALQVKSGHAKVLQDSLDILGSYQTPTDHLLRARVLYEQARPMNGGRLAEKAARYEKALEELKAAQDGELATADRDIKAQWLPAFHSALGELRLALGHYEQAMTHCQEATQQYQALGEDKKSEGCYVTYVQATAGAIVALGRGEIKEAKAVYQEGQGLFKKGRQQLWNSLHFTPAQVDLKKDSLWTEVETRYPGEHYTLHEALGRLADQLKLSEEAAKAYTQALSYLERSEGRLDGKEEKKTQLHLWLAGYEEAQGRFVQAEGHLKAVPGEESQAGRVRLTLARVDRTLALDRTKKVPAAQAFKNAQKILAEAASSISTDNAPLQYQLKLKEGELAQGLELYPEASAAFRAAELLAPPDQKKDLHYKRFGMVNSWLKSQQAKKLPYRSPAVQEWERLRKEFEDLEEHNFLRTVDEMMGDFAASYPDWPAAVGLYERVVSYLDADSVKVKVSEINEKLRQARVSYAQEAIKAKDYKLAAEQASLALEMEDSLEVALFLADALLVQERHEEAAAAYEKVASLGKACKSSIPADCRKDYLKAAGALVKAAEALQGSLNPDRFSKRILKNYREAQALYESLKCAESEDCREAAAALQTRLVELVPIPEEAAPPPRPTKPPKLLPKPRTTTPPATPAPPATAPPPTPPKPEGSSVEGSD